MKKQLSNSRRGMALVEVLFVVLLLGIFALVATRVFTTTIKTLYHADAQDASLRAMDSALAQLRADVWNASSLGAEQQRLVIDRPDGRVEWSVSDGRLNRSTGGGVKTWTSGSAVPAFEVAGPAVRVVVSDRQGNAPTTQCLVSQVMLQGGVR